MLIISKKHIAAALASFFITATMGVGIAYADSNDSNVIPASTEQVKIKCSFTNQSNCLADWQ